MMFMSNEAEWLRKGKMVKAGSGNEQEERKGEEEEKGNFPRCGYLAFTWKTHLLSCPGKKASPTTKNKLSVVPIILH